MRKLKLVLLIFGIFLFIALVYKIGPSAIFSHIAQLRWKILLIIPLYLLVNWFDTMGWKFAFGSYCKGIKFRNLFLVRLAGESVNYITPLGTLGGEPLKAHLLRKLCGLSMKDGISSVVIAKTTVVISGIIFVILGFSAALFNHYLPLRLQNSLSLLVSLGAVFTLVFYLGQKRGLFTLASRFLKRFRITPAYLRLNEEKIKELDQNIAFFYNNRRSDFLLSILFHLLGWIAGILEVYVILSLLGMNCTILMAFIIEALAQLVKSFSFIIPASIGAQEGGNLVVFLALGIGAVPAITMSILRRIRELIWAGIGLLILWGYELAPAKGI